MSALLEGAKKLVSRSPDIGARVAGLESALEASAGRIDDEVLDHTRQVVDRAVGRLRLSADHTVVALAGATGSGKSSTFNALTDLELSAVGVRRPTTSWATACVWGSEGAEELLEWLGIPARHQVTRDSMLSTGREDNALAGTVLLDLPDHDSTEVSHHLEVDRLVQLADLLVWVLDPQKYADAAIHDRYLAPLASHSDVMVVVLNQIDRVPEERRAAMLADVRRLLDLDGLHDVPVIGVSSKQGWGIEELKEQIRVRVKSKKATKARLEADVRTAGAELGRVSGTTAATPISSQRVTALTDALADSAGVPTVVEAVRNSTTIRARRATGWPLTAWIGRLKPDPLKRLHLDLADVGKQLTAVAKTSMPKASGIQVARVDTEVRALADEVTAGLAPAWGKAVRAASVGNLPLIHDELDRSLATTDLGVDKLPWWTNLVRVLQWLLILTALAGGVWLAAGLLGIGESSTPEIGSVPVPTVMLLGGLGLGVLLALLCRVLVKVAANSLARTAEKRLRDGIGQVAQESIIGPVQAEIDAYETVRTGIAAATAS